MKKSRLNELAEETRRKEKLIAKSNDDNTDAARLTPEQLADEMAYIQQLKDEMKRIDEDLTEAEAKNRLYYLLGERTRWGGRGDERKEEFNAMPCVIASHAGGPCGGSW
jgi:hypothetical protein